MIPVVTPEEMAAVDEAAPVAEEVLIERAGYGVALAARRLLDVVYGARITVLAGRGNNGADGRVAARHLESWGAVVRIVEAGSLDGGARVPGRQPLDLVIDAAYGTGLNRAYSPPDPAATPVLAVDIPSGLSGTTGLGEAMRSVKTVTFAALKPGLLLGSGPDMSGEIEIVDIGLGSLVSAAASAWVVTDSDVSDLLPPRPRASHKWKTAVQIVGGSETMAGAPLMATRSAMRSGAGYVLLGIPGTTGRGIPPGEHVSVALPDHGWEDVAADASRRVQALVVGPGLGASGGQEESGAGSAVGRFLASTSVPAVVDADGLGALRDVGSVRSVAEARGAPLVLTPHEGEYARLTGHPPPADRITDVRATARETGAVVLLKGSPTVVCAPDGRALLVTSGSSRLATAGTGDVLSGMIAAFLARGLPPLEAAALAAHSHGRAASLGPAEGLVASDLPDAVSQWLSGLRR